VKKRARARAGPQRGTHHDRELIAWARVLPERALQQLAANIEFDTPVRRDVGRCAQDDLVLIDLLLLVMVLLLLPPLPLLLRLQIHHLLD
jgi:hypothetical protein